MERSSRTLVILIAAFFFLAFICGGLIFLLAGDEIVDFGRTAVLCLQLAGREDELDQPMGDDDTPLRFTIDSGDTARIIGTKLESASLVSDAELFADYVRVEGLDSELEAGTYFLNKTQTIRQIALALTDSRFSEITFTIIPGWRTEEIATAIDANSLFAFSGQEFLTVVGRGAQVDAAFANWVGLPPGASLEGFLYPDTYSLPPEVTPEMLRDALLEAFENAIDPEIEGRAAEMDLSLYEVVTLASIVHREAVQVDERPLIAGVFLNRLDLGMKLDADPTVQYPLGSEDNWWPRITADDYTGVDSEYNTYLVAGLPPGPIANPGISSISAVVNPEESEFLYFRADCRDDGYHTFAETFEEHVANGCQ